MMKVMTFDDDDDADVVILVFSFCLIGICKETQNDRLAKREQIFASLQEKTCVHNLSTRSSNDKK